MQSSREKSKDGLQQVQGGMRLSQIRVSPETEKILAEAKLMLPDLLLAPPPNVPLDNFLEAQKALHATIAVRPTRPTTAAPPLKTTLPMLNAALGGGIPAGRIVQLAGSPGSGKTLLAWHIAVSALRQGHCVIWLETTSSTLDIHTRLHQLCGDSGMQRLILIAIKDFDHCISVLRNIKHDHVKLQLVSSPQSHGKVLANPRVVILDCLAALISPILGLRDGAWNGHVGLNHIAVLLRWMAVHTRASVVVSNRVVNSDKGPKPALGNVWSCFADVTFMHERVVDSDAADADADADVMRQVDGEFKVCISSKRGAPKQFRFGVDENGIHDTVDV